MQFDADIDWRASIDHLLDCCKTCHQFMLNTLIHRSLIFSPSRKLMFAHGLRSLLTVALGIRLANGASDYMACGILVPQAFSCRGMPEWAQFLEAVTKNRAEGFKEDPVLAFQAQEILLKWQDKPYPPQDTVEGMKKVGFLKGGKNLQRWFTCCSWRGNIMMQCS